MAAASGAFLVALAPAANAAPDCAVGTAGDDTCVITLNNTASEDVDAGANTAAGDKLQFGGAANFSFDVGRLGTPAAPADLALENFELFEKIDANTVTLTGIADVTANWTVTAGTLLATGHTVAGAGNIADNASVTVASGATFGILGAGGNSETIGSLSGVAGSFVTLGGTGVLNAGANGANTTFAGEMSGTGGFTKAGTGTMILSGANTFFTGALSVTGGVLEIGNANAIAAASSVTISAGALSSKGIASYAINGPVTITTTSQLSRLTGNAIITGKVSSNGGLQPGNTSVPTWPAGTTAENVGQDMGQITINGDYEATGSFAYVGMFIDIDASLAAGGVAGTDKDFLAINGNMLGTLPTKFSVASFDQVPVGGATTGNGIQVINITGTSANAGNEFYQGNALVAGAYQYLLRYLPNYTGGGGADGYFLQSAARDELVAQPAMLSASQQLIRGCFRDDQRVPDSPKGATYGRAWFGYHQGATEFGADTGIELDLDYSCTSGGMDWRMGHGWFGGVSGGFGSANGDLATPAGTADLDGSARVIEAYTSFTSSSFFVNLSAGYADTDWDVTDAFSGVAQTSVSGFIAQAQAGLALDLDIVAVKLIGAVNYDDQSCGENCLGFAVNEDTGLIEGKGTVRFDGVTWGGSIRPWASVSYSDVLSDGVNTVSLGAVSVSSATNEELLSLDAGLQTYLDENFAVFVDGGYHESLSRDINGYKGGVGLKLYW
jgi:autotransporter-associated beta strand protein